MSTSRVIAKFISLTVHYVTTEFDLVSYPLEVSTFPEKHTGVRIAAKICNMMREWDLDISRVAKLVRDNGSNIVKACDDLGVKHFGCMAHSLHLVVTGALSKYHKDVCEMDEESENCDDVAEIEEGEEMWVEDIENELEAIACLEKELEEIGVPSIDVVEDDNMPDIAKGKDKLKALQTDAKPLTVINYVTTRWNSTHQMIRRLIVLKPVVLKFLEFIRTSRGKEDFSDVNMARPTGEMWFTIECLDKLLVSFNGMTEVLSGDSYPTITLAFPCLRLLERRLKSSNIFTKVARSHLGEHYYAVVLKQMHLVRRLLVLLLKKQFKDIPLDVKYCCLLDPHFANVPLREEGALFLEDEAIRLTEVALYFDQCKLLEKSKSVNKAKSKRRKKLDGGLKWWKDNASDFPLLAPVARKFFGIVATSVPSERCFSRAGNAITAQRNRLTGEHVRDILFLHCNSMEDDPCDDESDAGNNV
ncbi:hypothetical protein PHMEG_00021659 [Phytophthora megakarya]|uniref:HAT C-terminal dimerisation domain-containing protein n=1 Tax=Phytophthora megakarya TaxID=4795 RepID=A0A225VLB7_9STRA|nr:hypothetical protein PHMEG_00021659 [Phytophthora megakarya]